MLSSPSAAFSTQFNFRGLEVTYTPARIKGAPGLECRTYTRLVSPAIGREKIKWNPLFFDKIRYLEFN